MSTIWIVVILGIVEGLTEFIPVSSTGHLILTSHLFAFESAAFEVVIQVGAILAVIFLYWERFLGLFTTSTSDNQDFVGLRAWQLLALTTFPALVLGWSVYPVIKESLFEPLPVAIALITGGVGLILCRFLPFQPSIHSVDQLGYRQALLIGLWQCLALWPGMSRAASTIVGSQVLGLNKKTAAEYSFFAAVPILLCASVYDLYKNYHLLDSQAIYYLLVGMFVSFVFASLAIKGFIKVLQTWSLAPFGVYRIFVGGIFLLLAYYGGLEL